VAASVDAASVDAEAAVSPDAAALVDAVVPEDPDDPQPARSPAASSADIRQQMVLFFIAFTLLVFLQRYIHQLFC
jgi:hypothetical protein